MSVRENMKYKLAAFINTAGGLCFEDDSGNLHVLTERETVLQYIEAEIHSTLADKKVVAEFILDQYEYEVDIYYYLSCNKV